MSYTYLPNSKSLVSAGVNDITFVFAADFDITAVVSSISRLTVKYIVYSAPSGKLIGTPFVSVAATVI